MTPRSLVRILILLAIGWGFILSPGFITYWSILRSAHAYRRAEFLVTGRNCIGGSGGRGSSTSRTCFLTGKVLFGEKSADEEFCVGSALPEDRPVGSRFAIYYNPALPAYGMNYLNQRILPAEEGHDPATLARRWLWTAARFLLLSLGAAIAVYILLRIGVRRLSDPPRRLAIDLGGGHAVLGTILFSQGLAFLLGQIPNPAWAGIVMGLLLAGVGAPFLLRHLLVLSKDEGRATRSRHFLGLTFGQIAVPLSSITKVSLEGSAKRYTIIMMGATGSESFQSADSYDRALENATRLADFFGVAVNNAVLGRDNRESPGAQRGRRWPGVLLRIMILPLVLATFLATALFIIDRPTETRLSLAAKALEPFGLMRQVGPVRRWALDRLAGDPSPAALLELLRVLNTVDAMHFPEVAADIDAAVARRAGLSSLPEQDREAQVRRINTWAASHLGRSVDANGGVLGWMEVAARFVDPINTMTSRDINSAWREWNHFAAGDLITTEQFLYAVGAALADPRPIHFAITRSGASFEGQPNPIDSQSEPLALTVGEALALQLWLKEGVGDGTFPQDFGAWWARWAHEHRLPPPPGRGGLGVGPTQGH